MSTPLAFSRIREIKDLPELEKFPQGILLDFGDEATPFYSVCQDLECFEDSIDDDIAEVLMYLVDKDLVESSVQELHNSIREIHSRECQGVNAQAVADAFSVFARSMHRKLELFGLYTKEGLLPYVMKRRVDEQTLYLQRHHIFKE